MSRVRVWAAVLLMVATACSRAREYEVRGQILAVDQARQEVTIKHEDIRGFMPAMTMPFKVSDARLIEGRAVGDLVRATLVVHENQAYLSAMERTGHAPVTDPPPARSAADILEPGDLVADAQFVDQSGTPRQLSSWKGIVRAVTFVYTRCPLPDFCPLMDRRFAAIQRAIAADRAVSGRVHLLSVSIDPDYDTPAVLAPHARRVAANPAHWTFLTGTREEIDRFASRFGLSLMREDPTGREIVHNLRTAVIDREGRLVKVFVGNDWAAEQVVAELKGIAVR